MKAIVHTRYGPPELLELQEVEKPAPSDTEVLVKVHAASLNASDWEILRGTPLYARIGGLFKPSYPILGSDIAGQVEMAGKDAAQFQVGDKVFGCLFAYKGGFAEYACSSEHALARIAPGMTFDQAAAIPQSGVIALQGIRDRGKVQPGQQVLINGAGGGAGSFAVQLAKLHGAAVTGVDNAGKLDFIRSLGADHVIDYKREDFTRNGKQYDLILDVIAHRSVSDYQRALAPGGTYFFVGGSVSTLFRILLFGSWVKSRTGKNIRLLSVDQNAQDLIAVMELCRAGKIVPVIDRQYPLREVPDALRYLGAGLAKGKVVINVA